MTIADTLRNVLIIPDLHATRKLDVIKEIVAHIAQHHDGVNPKDVVRALADRERAGSTAIAAGLAVPHCKLEPLTEHVACLGRSRKGVDFGAPDRQPTHFFFTLLASVDSAGRHLMVLARVSRIFNDSEFRARLMAVKTADEMRQIIADQEAV